jgi:hypothetical protein
VKSKRCYERRSLIFRQQMADLWTALRRQGSPSGFTPWMKASLGSGGRGRTSPWLLGMGGTWLRSLIHLFTHHCRSFSGCGATNRCGRADPQSWAAAGSPTPRGPGSAVLVGKSAALPQVDPRCTRVWARVGGQTFSWFFTLAAARRLIWGRTSGLGRHPFPQVVLHGSGPRRWTDGNRWVTRSCRRKRQKLPSSPRPKGERSALPGPPEVPGPRRALPAALGGSEARLDGRLCGAAGQLACLFSQGLAPRGSQVRLVLQPVLFTPALPA